MMRKALLVLFFWALVAPNANAALFSASSELRQILAEPEITFDDYELSKDDLDAFYTARNFRPAWEFSGSERAATLEASISSIEKLIEYHGLQQEDYAVASLRKLAAAPDEENRMKLEVLVSDTLLRLAHDLHGDSTDLDSMYPGWNFHRSEMDIPATMATAVDAGALHEYFETLPPQNPAYTQLAQALRQYRDIEEKGGWKPIDKGASLKLGEKGKRVAQLRARLAAEDYLPAAPLEPGDKFGQDLKLAVESYQTRNGLEVDGSVGPKVLEALNTPLTTRIDQIRANMERWRHMPDGFPPERYTLVNIPNASVVIAEGGKVIYHGIVIVGRVDRKTPFIQSNIRSMIVNPIWHVPSKIARKDILPKLKEDPHYLEKLGIVIIDSEDDPHGDNIDWASVNESEFNYKLRQSPGDLNSLGRLKFDFDNEFAVYMHGTPHQELFKKNERSLSSGCVRLHDPSQVAQIILSGNKDPWDAQKITDEINSNKTHWVKIANPMPLFILYWTVFTDDEGRLNFRKDVYDYDAFLMQNLRGETPTLKPNKP